MKKLEGKVAIVTGAGRGIGRAIATKLASDGASVVINDLDPVAISETADLVRAAGAKAHAVSGDVTAPDFGDRLVGEALATFGGIDIIVNNAGYIWNTTIQKNTDEQWYAMLDVHATAPFRILRAASNYFREAAKREGQPRCRKVVNVSSMAGVTGAATMAAYSAGKAAIIGLTKTLSKEWGRYNVTVNCVAFGLIETRLTQEVSDAPKTIEIKGHELKVGLDAGTRGVMNMLTPLGRPGTPEEAAGAVYLFCIPESDYVSGEVLLCAGGLLA
jgi:3-oxoacyl-[acyl-carrier protein] reductase